MSQPPIITNTSSPLTATIGALLEAMRPKQWIKNAFVLAPLIFGQSLTDPIRLKSSLIAFISFCLTASGLYLINDIIDRKEDQQHPVKRNRPIAAGRVAVSVAFFFAATLFVTGLTAAFVINLKLGWLVALYVVLNFFYSLALKHQVVLDVMIIAFGFVLRVIAGAVAVGIAASHWILLCTFLLALFLGFTKRRHELTILMENSRNHRRVLDHYSPALLDQMNMVVLGATVVAYAIYTVAPETIAKFQTDHLIYTLPFVIYGLFRYLYLTHQRNEGGSPTDLLIKDRPLILCVVLWAAACTAIIYFDFLH